MIVRSNAGCSSNGRLTASAFSESFVRTVSQPVRMFSLVLVFWCPVSIQTQSLALGALRKQRLQETQALAFTQQTQAPANRNARSKQWQPWLAACQCKRLRFLQFSFTQRKLLRLNGNRAWLWSYCVRCLLVTEHTATERLLTVDRAVRSWSTLLARFVLRVNIISWLAHARGVLLWHF